MKIEPDTLFITFENPFLFFKNPAAVEAKTESNKHHVVEQIKDVSPRIAKEIAP